jgi:hypothetical protein
VKKRLLDRTTINQILIAVTLLICYGYFFPRWSDPNQNSRLDMVIAVVDDGTFAIDKYVSNTVDFAHFNGHYYSDKPPGAAFLGMPFYAGVKVLLKTPFVDSLVNRLANNKAFQSTLKADGSGVYADKVRFAITQVILTVFIAVIPTVVLALCLFRLLLGFNILPGLSAVVVLVYGLLTPAYAYAGAFYSHQLSAACLMGAFLAARTNKSFTIKRLLLIGLLLSYAVISEYPTVLAAGVLFFYTVYVLARRKQARRIVWVILMAVIGAMVILIYNKSVFGSPFSMGYSFSENWTVQHQTGFMSLTAPHWDAIWGITFGVFRGLFVLSPILLLGLLGFGVWWRHKEYRGEFFAVVGIILAMFLFNASSVMWWGGFSIGPRYFLPALPFICLGMGFSLEKWGKKAWFKIVFSILALWSFGATWGMTLAGQSFPPDTLPNPYLSYALVNWQNGNIARNLATVLGLSGLTSLLPLFIGILFLIVVWFKWIFAGEAPSRPYPTSNQVHEGQPVHGA